MVGRGPSKGKRARGGAVGAQTKNVSKERRSPRKGLPKVDESVEKITADAPANSSEEQVSDHEEQKAEAIPETDAKKDEQLAPSKVTNGTESGSRGRGRGGRKRKKSEPTAESPKEHATDGGDGDVEDPKRRKTDPVESPCMEDEPVVKTTAKKGPKSRQRKPASKKGETSKAEGSEVKPEGNKKKSRAELEAIEENDEKEDEVNGQPSHQEDIDSQEEEAKPVEESIDDAKPQPKATGKKGAKSRLRKVAPKKGAKAATKNDEPTETSPEEPPMAEDEPRTKGPQDAKPGTSRWIGSVVRTVPVHLDDWDTERAMDATSQDTHENPEPCKDDLLTDAEKPNSESPPAAQDDESSDMREEAEPSNYWLFKSEPETRMEKGVDMKFGIDDLLREPNQTACWDGVRNHMAKNCMREMKLGDRGFFYHSNTRIPGIIGVVEVVKESYPDHTQFDSKDPHYDPKAEEDMPRWFMVDVKYERTLKRYISLRELKAIHAKHKKSGGPLANIALFTKARLSVQPVSKDEWDYILGLEDDEEKA